MATLRFWKYQLEVPVDLTVKSLAQHPVLGNWRKLLFFSLVVFGYFTSHLKSYYCHLLHVKQKYNCLSKKYKLRCVPDFANPCLVVGVVNAALQFTRFGSKSFMLIKHRYNKQWNFISFYFNLFFGSHSCYWSTFSMTLFYYYFKRADTVLM